MDGEITKRKEKFWGKFASKYVNKVAGMYMPQHGQQLFELKDGAIDKEIHL